MQVRVVVDGVAVPLPRSAKGIILLNISSFMGGARPWPALSDPGSADDGVLEARGPAPEAP